MMFKCLFIRRKLYDYLDDNLSQINKIRVREHLDVCNNCRARLGQIKTIVDLAAQKKTPKLTDESWYDFKIDLDRRLSDSLIGPVSIERRLSYRFRPVFAYAAILLFVLAIGSYLYKNPYFPFRRIEQDQLLVDEIAALEELGETLELNNDEESYIEEINLFYQLDQI